MSAQRLLFVVIPLVLLGLCLAPASVMAKKPPNPPPPGDDDPPCFRDIWASTPDAWETADNGDDTSLRLTMAITGERVVARFQISTLSTIKRTISVDGFEFTQLQGTPGDVQYRVYYLNSGLNCYSREVNVPNDFTLYGQVTPLEITFTVDNAGTLFTQPLAYNNFCVFVTAQNVSGSSGEVFQLGVDYSYTKGTNRWALNADCEKYQTYGLSNDKSSWNYQTNSERTPPALTFVEFTAP